VGRSPALGDGARHGAHGSGKTTTLYSALSELNKAAHNISTAEDPVEYNLHGINQVQMHDEIGLNFAMALRAFLRQDPDIIMVGEIRDFETAEIAVKAALTGHMVLSTLHTNDAPATISRLLNMGVEPFLITASVNLVLAQRLARKICADCKQPIKIRKKVLEDMGFTAEQIAEGEAHEGRRLPHLQRHAATRGAWRSTRSCASPTPQGDGAPGLVDRRAQGRPPSRAGCSRCA
jgi:type IV pilus assembly protein PilB